MKKEKETIEKENKKVKFINTYIGELGNYYTGIIYELAAEKYEVLKNDCEEK